MEEDLIKITPNKEKARSIFRMVETTLEMIEQIDKSKFPSSIAKEYYEVIRELTSIFYCLTDTKQQGKEHTKDKQNIQGQIIKSLVNMKLLSWMI